MSVKDEFELMKKTRLAVEDVNSSPSSDGGKIDKSVVNYRVAEDQRFRCGTCSMFESPGSCSLVSGIISPEGVCDKYEPVNTGSGGFSEKVGKLPSERVGVGVSHEMSLKPLWRVKFENDCHNPGGEGGGEFCSSGGSGGELSSSKPTSKANAAAYVPGSSVKMTSDLIGDKAVAETIRRQANVPGFEDFAGRTDRAALGEIENRMAGNIADSVDRAMGLNKDTALQHSEWYPIASKWTGELAEKTGFSKDAVVAATAVLSPGADWAHNVAWAANIANKIKEDPVVDKKVADAYFTTRMAAYQDHVDKATAAGKTWTGKAPEYPSSVVGKKLSELSDKDAAVAIRGMSDAPGGTVMQLGGRAGFGDPDKKAIPQSDTNLTKAVSVLRNPSTANIDDQLGDAHKVRSFYNNIRDPGAANQEVTSDTHHFGLSNDEPWGISSKFIASGKDSVTAAPSTGETGVKGTYALVADATRKATDMVNEKYGLKLQPAQVQSIVWENHRARYPSTLRSNKTMVAAIDQAHTDRALGKIKPAEEQTLIENARLKAGGPTDSEMKTWYGQDLKGEIRTDLKDLRNAKGKGGKK